MLLSHKQGGVWHHSQTLDLLQIQLGSPYREPNKPTTQPALIWVGWVTCLTQPIVVPTYMKLSVIEGLIGYMDHASARVRSQGARMISFSFACRLYNPSVLTVCGSYATSLCCFLSKLNYAKYHARPFIEIYYNFILD